MKRSHWLIILYLLLVIFPVLAAALWGSRMGNSFLWEMGRNFALMGFMLLALQFVLAARFQVLERSFGFDILIRFHKHMGLLAIALLIGHPLLLAMGGGGIGLLVNLSLPWYVMAAKLGLLLLVVNVLLSIYSERMRIQFERWRLTHDLLAPAIIVLGFLHSRRVGSDLRIPVVRWYWTVVFILILVIFVYHRWIRPWRLSRHPWQVTGVKKEVGRVWTVKLEPPEGQQVFDYLPGQFQFITFHRGCGLPVEEHHWTISSSPARKESVTTTIKELGDFTATIGQTRPGDTATVHAPFGRFSYLLRPGETDLVFIAGGIGITPLIGMLRHMRDTAADLSVLLIYANRGEEDIAFREEIDRMAGGERPRFSVVHLLSKPGEGWTGERGRLDKDKLKRYCQDRFQERTFYLCGPPPMIAAAAAALKELGVADGRIETEVFSFLG
jgi:predicted ferric reductase